MERELLINECLFCYQPIKNKKEVVCNRCPELFTFVKCSICRCEFSIPKILDKGNIPKLCGQSCRNLYECEYRSSKVPVMHTKRFRSHNRSRKIKMGDKIDVVALYNLFEWTCIVCDESIDRDLKNPDPMSVTLDHIIPLSNRDGTHTWMNVGPSHLQCNTEKDSDVVDDIIEKVRGFWRASCGKLNKKLY